MIRFFNYGAVIILALCASSILAQEEFNIRIERGSIEDNLVTSTIYLNGAQLGKAYENAAVKISAGTYRGVMRYSSGRGHVQGPGGVMGNTGDFLLEAVGVADRTDILLHAGTRPEHSRGCILLGPANRGPDGGRTITDDHPLYKLRLAFYGTDTPNASPNKLVTITIIDP